MRDVSTTAAPRISFLRCSLYDCNAARSTYLCEKRLNPKRYKKWNNNAGGLDGVTRHDAAVKPAHLELIEEEDEDVGEEEEVDRGAKGSKSAEALALEAQIFPEDVLQAFSHWTYVYSKRDFLVCDLQGELTVAGPAPAFELTDPCIHTSKDRGRLFGNTDRGKKGQLQFFHTHQCNAVCKLLGIENKSPFRDVSASPPRAQAPQRTGRNWRLSDFY